MEKHIIVNGTQGLVAAMSMEKCSLTLD
jgi:hypothetical protein